MSATIANPLPFNQRVIITGDTHRPANIADDIVSFLNRYVAFPDPRQADVVALWVLHTHCFDAAYATPYIYVNSTEPGSGKTRTIEVIETIARQSLRAASVSPAALFRKIEQDQPTMLIDEVDTIFSGAANDDLRGVLNDGYKRGSSVLRYTGKDVESYSAFCPKLLAGLDNGEVPPTIADRSISITLRRKSADQKVERFMSRKVEPLAADLKDRITEWSIANTPAMMDAEPKVIDGISDRAFEIAEPLLAIADRLRGWHQRARDAIVFLNNGGPKPLNPMQKVIDAANQWLKQNDESGVPTAVLADLTGMTGKRMAGLLDAADVKSITFRYQGKTAKGYTRAAITDAAHRFLPQS